MPGIALFNPAFEVPGGAEFLCLYQAQSLRKAGEDVCLVTLAYDAATWGGLVDGLPIRLVQKRHWSDLFFGLSRLGKVKARGRRASQMFLGCKVVVAHNAPCNAMLGASSFQGRKVWQCNEPLRELHVRKANPVITTRVETAEGALEDQASINWTKNLMVHDAEISRGRPKALRALYDLEQTARLDHIFAISAFSRDNARQIYGRCGEEVVYPMVRFPEAGRSRSGLDRSGLQVLVHSRLGVLKNIDTVIRGFASFRASHPGAHLHLVGDGPARPWLESFAKRLLPDGGATFHGFLPQEELGRVYDTCDVMALLTLDEPFGMVYPEAASRGLLLIGPDHGGPLEILDGGRLGWCVDAFSPTALEQALCEIWSLPEAEVDRRRTQTDQTCRSRFSEAVIGPQLRRVILEGHD